MSAKPLQPVLRYLNRVALASVAAATSDAELLGRFVEQHDEAAFELLVWRHGKMVLGLCRRVLRHQQDAEDAFQATFLALARKGSGIRKRTSIGGWLYRVAYRTALAARRGRREQPLGDVTVRTLDPASEAAGRELRRALDEEVNRLPERYRLPLILCHFTGKSNAEAARELGCPCGTLESRLARARARLRTALARRGFALAAAGVATALTRAVASAGPAPVLVSATARAATLFRVGDRGVPPEILALTRKVRKIMFLTKLKVVATLLLMAGGAALLGRPAADKKPAADELIVGETNALRLSAATRARLDIRTAEVKRRATPPRMLQLIGSLALDPDGLAAVRARITGEVVQVKVRLGERVKRDAVLVVLWSTDVGSKKIDLVDALVQLDQDERRLKDRVRLYEQGSIPLDTVEPARRNVASDRNAIGRAERTLRTWNVPQAEIDAVREEARQILKRGGKRDKKKEESWARSEIRAPRDGTVVERNVNVGDFTVGGADKLFVLADLSRLLAIAQAAEADLPALQALTPAQRRWSVRPGVDRDAPAVRGHSRSGRPSTRRQPRRLSVD